MYMEMNALKTVFSILLLGQLTATEGTCRRGSSMENSCATSWASEIKAASAPPRDFEVDGTCLLQMELNVKHSDAHKDLHKKNSLHIPAETGVLSFVSGVEEHGSCTYPGWQ